MKNLTSMLSEFSIKKKILSVPFQILMSVFAIITPRQVDHDALMSDTVEQTRVWKDLLDNFKK